MTSLNIVEDIDGIGLVKVEKTRNSLHATIIFLVVYLCYSVSSCQFEIERLKGINLRVVARRRMIKGNSLGRLSCILTLRIPS